MSETETDFRCGYVAIVGRPNVGKSTLLNAVLGQKISITSRKPQTTRHNILGIHTDEEAQILFVDTPGQHLKAPRAINRYMNRTAGSALSDVDLIIFLVDRLKWNEEDDLVCKRVRDSGKPTLVVLNKIDRLSDKQLLLPHIEEISQRLPEVACVPLSALKKEGLDELVKVIKSHLPNAEPLFSADDITDRPMRFMVAEIVREKIMRQLGEEVPYAATVEIEKYTVEGRLTRINALVWVERPGQKTILIGSKGSRLKQIGIDARKDIEALCGTKVMLEIWVKVKTGWSDDDRALQSLGYQ